MTKTISALLAVTAIAGSLAATPASAQRGLGAGLAAGLIGGAIVGGAIASSRPAYAAPVYVDEPRCRIIRPRYYDEYRGAYVLGRPRQVCD